MQGLARTRRIAHERAHDTKPVPRGTLDVVCAVGEEARDRAADVAVAEERYGNVDGHRLSVEV